MQIPIPLTPCDSNQIFAFGYDEATQTLALQFKRAGEKKGERVAGSVYFYSNVTPKDYAAFCASDSKGSYFGNVIKPQAQRWPFVKQEEEERSEADGVS